MIRNLCLALALLAGLFVASPRQAEAAPMPVAAASTLDAGAGAALTQVHWYGRRHGWGHRHYGFRPYGFRRHYGYGRPWGWRHRHYGWGHRHWGHRRHFYRY